MIVGLIFLRYISSAFERRYQELVAEDDGFEDEKDAYLMENIFFVPRKHAGRRSPQQRISRKSAR